MHDRLCRLAIGYQAEEAERDIVDLRARERGVLPSGLGQRCVADSSHEAYPQLMHDAMMLALSGRVHVDEVVEAKPEQILHEIWEDHFLLKPAIAEPG